MPVALCADSAGGLLIYFKEDLLTAGPVPVEAMFGN